MEQHNDQGLAAVSCLDDPVRRRLYEYVAGQRDPVGRDEAAAATGIGRPLAAYHLDKLVGLGLLTASFQRPGGRGGPGAGRPAKLYTRSAGEFSVSVPPRDYELAARLLAAAVAEDRSGASRAALQGAARRFGLSLAPAPARGAGNADAGASVSAEAAAPAGAPQPAGTAGETAPAASAGQAASAAPGTSGADGAPACRSAAADTALAVLRAHGYEPWRERDGTIRLRNCPFHQLAEQHREVVCGMNLALIEGLVAGLATSDLQPSLEPRPGCCCVAIGTGSPSGAAPKTGES
ncbi:MAG TPA: transcriptional regulator [Streptosporangiaceae bacterium]|nr:transcriptional regulator [Streptosporangiaceae bacterium]